MPKMLYYSIVALARMALWLHVSLVCECFEYPASQGSEISRKPLAISCSS